MIFHVFPPQFPPKSLGEYGDSIFAVLCSWTRKLVRMSSEVEAEKILPLQALLSADWASTGTRQEVRREPFQQNCQDSVGKERGSVHVLHFKAQ